LFPLYLILVSSPGTANRGIAENNVIDPLWGNLSPFKARMIIGIIGNGTGQCIVEGSEWIQILVQFSLEEIRNWRQILEIVNWMDKFFILFCQYEKMNVYLEKEWFIVELAEHLVDLRVWMWIVQIIKWMPAAENGGQWNSSWSIPCKKWINRIFGPNPRLLTNNNCIFVQLDCVRWFLLKLFICNGIFHHTFCQQIARFIPTNDLAQWTKIDRRIMNMHFWLIGLKMSILEDFIGILNLKGFINISQPFKIHGYCLILWINNNKNNGNRWWMMPFLLPMNYQSNWRSSI